ncbi:hypothetical protein ALC57_03725 [Trachymyrmex cornetzi]|uniref:Uncharacterized protein n=1 Tax=Trachymyrmex cornetzi TaxID=471704 RepID=A0A151JMB8_9HYME|nr:hypothetical protein ALC57_03725 [Trachymyrmex cornetzi]
MFSELLIASILAIYWFSSSSYFLDILRSFMYSVILGLLAQQSKGTSSPPRFIGSIGPSLPFAFPVECVDHQVMVGAFSGQVGIPGTLIWETVIVDDVPMKDI